MTKTSPLTIGTDFEAMIFSRPQNCIVSAIPVLKHSKENKINLGGGDELYYDNTLLETSAPPAFSRNDFTKSLQSIFGKVSSYLGDKYRMEMTAAHYFTKEECSHPDAIAFGCNPSFDAYEMAVCSVADASETTLRTGSGHIHIGRADFKEHLDNADGIPLMDPYNKADVIRLMDIFVGIPFTIIDKDPTSVVRKALYGAPGNHRPCQYGVEYRVLSNFWLRSPKLVELIYDLTNFVVDLNYQGETENLLTQFDAEEIQNIINNNEIENGWKFIEKLKMPADLKARIKEADSLKTKNFNTEWNVGG